ncbi:MAG TPA: hypothetical protein VKA21_10090 [Candidatus Binatia bacterium]|nr:hypothetical protein [Candidatus Binatia bacterium]
MRIKGRGVVLAVLVIVGLAAATASADNNPNGVAFRAVGWFKGKAEISEEGIKCEIPTIKNAIADGSFAMGLWNTFGFSNNYFPDINGPFSNPCGGWVQLQNNLQDQAISLDRIEMRYKIPGARRFRQFVPTQNAFPIACRELRRDTQFVGALINPINSTVDQSGSGSPNVTFIEILPIVSAQMFNCLRSQYGPLPADLFTSLPLVVRARVFGTSDAGTPYKSNVIPYTLNLRHMCGNGRLDDGEQCDPAAPFTTCLDECLSGSCSLSGKPCASTADCIGTCVGTNNPSECACVF